MTPDPDKPVLWIAPIARRSQVVWPHTCEAVLTTPQTIEWHKANHSNAICRNGAKVNFRGLKLCVRHAQLLALQELAGEMPDFIELKESRDGM